MNTANYLVLSFKEWTNWIEFGLLRNLQRIRAYTGTEKSFNDLLSITPDITHREDNEFIFAKLHDCYHKYIYQDDYLSLESVECFYSVSKRGKNLLSHTADKMKVILNADDEIEQKWDIWCTQQKNIMTESKAEKFYEILFDDETFIKNGLEDKVTILKKLNHENNQFIRYLKLFESSFKNKKICPEPLEKDYYNTKAYGGMATRFLAKEYIVNKNVELDGFYKSSFEILDLKKYYSELKAKQTYSELTQTFFDCKIVREKIILEKFIKEHMQENIPLLALSMYFHYEMLINNEREINLTVFKNDLQILKMFTQNSCSNTVYLIVYLLGQKIALPYAVINSLYYAKKLDAFLSVKKDDFEPIINKLPLLGDSFSIDEFYKGITDSLQNYEDIIRERCQYKENKTLSDEKNEQDNQRLVSNMDVNEAVKQPTSNDRIDATESITNKNNYNGDLFPEKENKNELIIKIKNNIKNGTINVKSTWSDLVAILEKQENVIKTEINNILSKKIGNRKFQTIFNELQEKIS